MPGPKINKYWDAFTQEIDSFLKNGLPVSTVKMEHEPQPNLIGASPYHEYPTWTIWTAGTLFLKIIGLEKNRIIIRSKWSEIGWLQEIAYGRTDELTTADFLAETVSKYDLSVIMPDHVLIKRSVIGEILNAIPERVGVFSVATLPYASELKIVCKDTVIKSKPYHINIKFTETTKFQIIAKTQKYVINLADRDCHQIAIDKTLAMITAESDKRINYVKKTYQKVLEMENELNEPK